MINKTSLHESKERIKRPFVSARIIRLTDELKSIPQYSIGRILHLVAVLFITIQGEQDTSTKENDSPYAADS